MRAATAASLLLAACAAAEPSGEVETLAGGDAEGYVDGPGPEARFGPPLDVAADGAGNVYVADVFNSAIRRVSADGTVTTLAGGEEGFADGVGSDARFHLPVGLALADDDTLYVADAFNSVIRRVDLRTAEVTTVAGRPNEEGLVDGPLGTALFTEPSGIAVEPDTGRLWVVERSDNVVRIVDFSSGMVSTIAGNGMSGIADGVGAEARFNGPSGIAVDGRGGAWVTDRGNNTIRRIDTDGTVTTVLGTPLRTGFRDGMGADAILNRPARIARTPAGALVFTDQQNNVVRLFDQGTGTRTLAGEVYEIDATVTPYPPAEDGPAGEAVLRDPRGVAVAEGALIYFTDLFAVRVVRGWTE